MSLTPRTSRLAFASVPALGLLLASAPLHAQPQRITGPELASNIRSLTPGKPITLAADLEIKRDRNITHTPLVTRVILHSNSWESIYQAGTAQNREELRIRSRPGAPNEYLYRPSPEAEPQEMAQADLKTAFAQSDFSLFDLGREFLFWPHQTILKSQMRKSRSCRVLESKPPQLSAAPYSRVVSWIDIDTGGIVIAEAYDAQGKLFKEFEARNVRKINDEYQVDLQIWNVQTKSRTRLEFEQEP